ncbi:MAG: hypothetical protein J4F39_18610 [Candidatus Latescibacteria bacterium]|nr:hypothetical protein [Candidatus Latescibacterota bacterium]
MVRYRLLYLIISFVLVVSAGTVYAEKVTLNFVYKSGQSNLYKNSWTLEYYSGRADLIDDDKTSGTVDVRTYGKWKSTEAVTAISAEAATVTATVQNAESTVMEDRVQISETNFPYLLDMFNGRTFSWIVSPTGDVTGFKPGFKTYEVRREAAVSDLQQLWVPEIHPVLPRREVGSGDSWNGIRRHEIPIPTLQDKGSVEINSVYVLKRLAKKKGRRVALIDETRQMRYRGWIFSNAVSIMVEGTGEGKGKWTIDVNRGIVIGHEINMSFKEVDVTVIRGNVKVENAGAKMKLTFKREMDD